MPCLCRMHPHHEEVRGRGRARSELKSYVHTVDCSTRWSNRCEPGPARSCLTGPCGWCAALCDAETSQPGQRVIWTLSVMTSHGTLAQRKQWSQTAHSPESDGGVQAPRTEMVGLETAQTGVSLLPSWPRVRAARAFLTWLRVAVSVCSLYRQRSRGCVWACHCRRCFCRCLA